MFTPKPNHRLLLAVYVVFTAVLIFAVYYGLYYLLTWAFDQQGVTYGG